MATFNRVLEIFNEICSIPHPSGYTEKIRSYIKNFVSQLRLKYIEDKTGNIIVKKPGITTSKPIILQAHVDMVGVSDDPKIDMKEHSIQTFVEGGFLKAKGTSLGADDGIGVAYILAILEDTSLTLPPIEALFTVDEETGMDGAVNLEINYLEGERLINLDSEDEGELLSSSAGGVHFTEYYHVEKETVKGKLIDIKISGLYGGHSGQEISRCGANAIKLMFELTLELVKKQLVNVYEFKGGEALNIIPNNSSLTVVANDLNMVKSEIEHFESKIKEKYKATDKNIKVNTSVVDSKNTEYSVIKNDSIIDFIDTTTHIPCGVIEYSKEDKEFVVMSANYGKVSYQEKDNEIFFSTSFRSNDDDKKMLLMKDIENKVKKYSSLKYVVDAIYPGWKYKPSELRKIMKKVYKDMYGKEMVEKAIHAGLECGYFIEKRPSMDATSIGPNARNVHTTSEMLELSSAERVFEYLIKVLESL